MVPYLAMRFGEKIEWAARYGGWSIRKIAARAGVDYQALLRGIAKHDFGAADMLRIARSLGVPLEWLADDAQDDANLDPKPDWYHEDDPVYPDRGGAGATAKAAHIAGVLNDAGRRKASRRTPRRTGDRPAS